MKQIEHDLIIIEGEIEINRDLHSRKIEIAYNNLNDLNKRWSSIKEVIYVAQKFKFEPSDYTDSANYSVVDLLNKYINWDLSEGKDREYQVQTYFRSVQNRFEELNTELHYRKLTNGLSDDNRQEVKAFICNYRFFSPVGILSETEKNQIQSSLNKYCEELETNFLSVEEREFDLNLDTEEPLKETNVQQSHEKSSIDAIISLNQIFARYFRRKTNEDSLWTRLIGQ